MQALAANVGSFYAIDEDLHLFKIRGVPQVDQAHDGDQNLKALHA
jgi:hypothetical protein